MRGGSRSVTSGRGVRAGDEVDLRARQAEIVELAVGQTGELANGLAITEVGADLSSDHGDEHGGFPWRIFRTGAVPTATISLCAAYKSITVPQTEALIQLRYALGA